MSQKTEYNQLYKELKRLYKGIIAFVDIPPIYTSPVKIKLYWEEDNFASINYNETDDEVLDAYYKALDKAIEKHRTEYNEGIAKFLLALKKYANKYELDEQIVFDEMDDKVSKDKDVKKTRVEIFGS